jgi:MoaA/NifB/PqqE/SkfB family radical SAM enzyme
MKEVEYSTSKASWHTDKIRTLQDGGQITPTEIQIDLEAYCNDNCKFCSYRKEDGYNNMMLELIDAQPGKAKHENRPIGKPSAKSRIPLEFAEILPRQMKEAGIPAIELTGGGEPTLWPAFDQLYENLGLNGIDIGLVTNGSTMSDKRADLIRKYGMWCRISMDSATAATHQKVHGTANEDFKRRINAIKKLTTDKPDTLTIGISFILTPENAHEVALASYLYSKMGVDHLRFSWMYDKEGNAGFTPDEKQKIADEIARCQDEFDTDSYKIFTEVERIHLYTKPNTDFEKCYYQRFVMAIGADSKIYPCCIQKYHDGWAYADIREKSLKEIVYDINTTTFMDSLNVEACNPCWLRNRNKNIGASVETPKHHNFI